MTEGHPSSPGISNSQGSYSTACALSACALRHKRPARQDLSLRENLNLMRRRARDVPAAADVAGRACCRRHESRRTPAIRVRSKF